MLRFLTAHSTKLFKPDYRNVFKECVNAHVFWARVLNCHNCDEMPNFPQGRQVSNNSKFRNHKKAIDVTK